MMIDNQKLHNALSLLMGSERERRGIGTLGEKTLHAVLKLYYEEDKRYHEQKIGSFYADIARDGKITEIHTGNFYTLRKKLDFFLISHKVTVVFPIALNKTVCWIDPESGAVVSRRRSPKGGRIYDVLRELPAIKECIGDQNLTLRILLADMEDYRLLDGRGRDKKIGATKLERIPTLLAEEIDLCDKRDYMMLLPPELSDSFSREEFERAVRLERVAAHRALKLFIDLGFVRQSGKDGRKYIYSIVQ